MRNLLVFCLFSVNLMGVLAAQDPALDRTNYRPAPAYEAVRTTEASLPNQTLYRPADLAKLGATKMPIVAWGNGGCAANGGSSAEPALMELASQGYLVAAGGAYTAPPAARGGAAPPARGVGTAPAPGQAARGVAAPARGPASLDTPAPNQTATRVLSDFIDWAIAENARAASPYRGKIDTTKIALAGHSCGGLQAIALADDPRITTVVVLNSGTISRAGIPTPDGGVRQPSGYLPSSEADLKEFHTPVIYLIGGPTDVAYQGSESDFKAIERVPLFGANYPVGHNATYREERGGLFIAVVTDWLDWQLKDRQDLATKFMGPSCGLCSAPNWTVKRKNMS
jgi:hypothetical protein